MIPKDINGLNNVNFINAETFELNIILIPLQNTTIYFGRHRKSFLRA